MNEEELFSLLGAIVETNQRMIEQQERLLAFLQERDAGLPERTALDLEHARALVFIDSLLREDIESEERAFKLLGTSRAEVMMIRAIQGLRREFSTTLPWGKPDASSLDKLSQQLADFRDHKLDHEKESSR